MCHWVGKDYKAPEFYNPVGGDEVSPLQGRALILGRALRALCKAGPYGAVERAVTPRMLARYVPGPGAALRYRAGPRAIPRPGQTCSIRGHRLCHSGASAARALLPTCVSV